MRKPLSILYAIQNVGGINFSQDVGDTVPVKYTLLGLKKAGHRVLILRLRHQKVRAIPDIEEPDQFDFVQTGLSDSRLFRYFERFVRRIQSILRVPYFAIFDQFRFYQAVINTLPEYSICHEHNGLFCAGAAFASKRLGVPYVLTFSADPLMERELLDRPLRGLHKTAATWEARYTYRLAETIICVSKAAKEHLINHWKICPDKIVVMPNGVDVELFHPGVDPGPIRKTLNLQDCPVVAFVGGFQPWHGLDLLIEAFSYVHREIPDARLLLVGDGRARPLVDEKIEQFELNPAAIVTGLIPIQEVPTYLSAVDVAVLPYPKLPQELWFSPLKLYEYMAAGKAIIASDAGQISEVIDDGRTGLLVEPGNVDELYEKIVELLKHPEERQALGDAARKKAVLEHSWDQYIDRLEDIYYSALTE